jgi:hypothetical protein
MHGRKRSCVTITRWSSSLILLLLSTASLSVPGFRIQSRVCEVGKKMSLSKKEAYQLHKE